MTTSVQTDILAAMPRLSGAEQRIAEEVTRNPQGVAFGTVASLAAATGTSGATVVRFCSKLGHQGFTSLQYQVQDELAASMGPAAHRIRQENAGDVPSQALRQEIDNVERTLGGINITDFDHAVDLMARAGGAVILCPGDCARGAAYQFVDQLGSLRPRVEVADGSDVATTRRLALTEHDDVVVFIDFMRYDRKVLRAAQVAADRSVMSIALTDNAVGPLARKVDLSFVVSVMGVGPFDSQVATAALLNAFAAGVSTVARDQATQRLRRIEDAWQWNDVMTGTSVTNRTASVGRAGRDATS